MKCEACEGKGFTEREHGLIMVGCKPCNGTGEMPKEAPYTGLLFKLAGKRTDECSDVELWRMAREKSVETMEFPRLTVMPCGNSVRWNSPSDILDLIPVNVLCACDNPNHYIVRFIDEREVLPIGISASGGIPEGMEIPESKTTASPDEWESLYIEKPEMVTAPEVVATEELATFAGVENDSDSGAGPVDKPAGGEDTSKPKQPKKRKAKGKAKKRAHKVLQKAK